mgnify:CR=1 FL=1
MAAVEAIELGGRILIATNEALVRVACGHSPCE